MVTPKDPPVKEEPKEEGEQDDDDEEWILQTLNYIIKP